MRPVLLSLLTALVLAAPAAAAPDRAGKVSEASAAFSWDGASATGFNQERDPAACSHDVQTYCDTTLIHLDIPAGAVGEVKVTTGQYSGPQCTPLEGQSAPCDFSLWLYASDATGKAGKNLGSSINDSGEDEEINYKKATAGYYLVVVYYYTVAQASYKGTFALGKVTAPALPVTTPAVAPTAPLSAALAPGRLKGTSLPVRIACSSACKGAVTAEISAAVARKLKLGRKKMVIGRATLAEGATEVKLRLSRKVASKLARARGARVTIRVALTDPAGGQKLAASRTVAVRR